MDESLLTLFDLSAETRGIIATKPAAMPMREFLSFFLNLAAFHYRDAYQQERLDCLVQRMNVRIAECYRDPSVTAPQDDPLPENVIPLVRPPKEPA